ncbi:MAG TPA: hypothetical protein VGD75_16060, partial [Bradyrhizobium sp.]
TVSGKSGRAKSSPGLVASEIARDGESLRFTLGSSHRPFRVPDGAIKVLPYLPFQEQYNSITLAIRDLPPGRHLLRTGPNKVHVFDAEALAAGLNLATLAGSEQVDASAGVAGAINSKNTIYFSIWRDQALAFTGGEIYNRPIHRQGAKLSAKLDAQINQRVRQHPATTLELQGMPAPASGQRVDNGDFITHWTTTDPIAIDHQADALGGEAAASVVTDRSDHGVRWTPRQFDPATLSGCLSSLFRDSVNCLAYAKVLIQSPVEQQTTLLLGSDDGFAAWLNGEPIGENLLAQRGVSVDGDQMPVTLQAGENLLLIKIAQHLGGWGFCVRFTGLQQPVVADWPAA